MRCSLRFGANGQVRCRARVGSDGGMNLHHAACHDAACDRACNGARNGQPDATCNLIVVTDNMPHAACTMQRNVCFWFHADGEAAVGGEEAPAEENGTSQDGQDGQDGQEGGLTGEGQSPN